MCIIRIIIGMPYACAYRWSTHPVVGTATTMPLPCVVFDFISMRHSVAFISTRITNTRKIIQILRANHFFSSLFVSFLRSLVRSFTCPAWDCVRWWQRISKLAHQNTRQFAQRTPVDSKFICIMNLDDFGRARAFRFFGCRAPSIPRKWSESGGRRRITVKL